MRRFAPFVRTRRLATGALALLVASLLGAAVATAAGPAIQTITPRSANQITNLDVLRQQIRNYYGDPLGSGVFASDSNYAKEATSVAKAGARYLASHAHGHSAHEGDRPRRGRHDARDLELRDLQQLGLQPRTNTTFVLGQLFPAVPGMVDMVKKAAQEGYAIIWITGRPATQEAATLGNLTTDGIGVDAGYPAPTTLVDGEDGLFTKPAVADYPAYLKTACAAEIAAGNSCTTIHYKSATRAHIELLGYDIQADFGDQFSDFTGGFTDKTFKLPNPNYFLP